MKKLQWNTLFFFSIIILACSLRLFQLDQVPPGVNRDEAALGYNAYSLLMTGKDEYGRFFPLSFQSFGDWKLPVYIYESAISVKLLGLNTFAVRLPSVIAGVISVILSFFLVKELFGKTSFALLTMFLFAISPWSLHLSRVASEANTAVCIVLAGVLLFLKGIKKNNWLILLAAMLFALSFGTYASNYIFTPLLVLGLVFLYRKKIIKNRFGIMALIVFIVLSGFLCFQTTSANTVKLSGTSIFGDPSIVNAKIETPRNEHDSQGALTKVMHNRVSYGIERFVQNYLNAFSPDFLFSKGGGNHAHNIANFGNMYLVEAFFFFLGIAFFLSKKKTKAHYFVLWWLFIAPIAASLTKDAPHTVRMFAIFPIPAILVASGIMWFLASIPRRITYGVIGLLGVLFVANISVYFDRYYVHFPHNESNHWSIAYDKLASELNNEILKDKKVVMTGVEESAYIYLLFYSSYNPHRYQKEAIRYPMTSEGFEHVKGFGRFTFRAIDWGKDLGLANTILIDKTKAVPPSVRQQYKTTDILLPSGEPWFTIIQLQENLARR